MDKFITQILGRMPFVLNDFRFLDEIYRSTFVSYLKTLGADNMILHGCNITDNGNGTFTISEGAVVINAEFFLCNSHTFTCNDINEAYFVITESWNIEGLKKFGNNQMENTYLLRRVAASQQETQPTDSISVNSDRFEDKYIKEGDSRLTDSRRCNNTFDSPSASRTELDVYNKAETDTEIDTAINALINGSPGALDTLNELAEALGDDPNFAATITNALAGKVNKITGMGLSANDFTDALLNKLNNSVNYTHPSSHPISLITDLQAALDEKSAVGHTHINQSGWVNVALNNSRWQHVAGSPLSIRKQALGEVHLNGMVEPINGGSYVIGVLGVTWRPTKTIYFVVYNTTGRVTGSGYVGDNGEMFIYINLVNLNNYLINVRYSNV